MSTQEKILHKALEMFNERGIEYVGLRELAATLNMRVSNITYYFPTKDDLVYQIAQGLTTANNDAFNADRPATVTAFLEMLRQVFHNHVQYRCLLLSIVHVLDQNKVMQAKYGDTQNVRNATLQSKVEALIQGGYLHVPEASDVEFLISNLSLISRFWISEAAVSYRHLSTDDQIRHYLAMVAKLLRPYATGKGKPEIDEFLDSLATSLQPRSKHKPQI